MKTDCLFFSQFSALLASLTSSVTGCAASELGFACSNGESSAALLSASCVYYSFTDSSSILSTSSAFGSFFLLWSVVAFLLCKARVFYRLSDWDSFIKYSEVCLLPRGVVIEPIPDSLAVLMWLLRVEGGLIIWERGVVPPPGKILDVRPLGAPPSFAWSTFFILIPKLFRGGVYATKLGPLSSAF